ncbi:hypothetical protein ACWEQO_03155 [Streptomyces sp. NPDC004051]
MQPEHCGTRNHIEVWNERVLPPGAVQLRFRAVLRGSLLPILLWVGIACFVHFVYDPAMTAVLGGLFACSFALGFGLRRRAGHSARCSIYGALGGVLDKSMAGF